MELTHAHLLCTKPQVSLNEKDWDTHVSFTVMSLAASPDGKYLLGATDKSRSGGPLLVARHRWKFRPLFHFSRSNVFPESSNCFFERLLWRKGVLSPRGGVDIYMNPDSVKNGNIPARESFWDDK